MALIYNATFDKNTRKLSFEDRAGNEIYSFTVPERAPAVDDITKPLTLRAIQDKSTLRLENYGSPSGSFQTSRDGGNTWEDYTIGRRITLNIGDEVSFRAKSDRKSWQNTNAYFYFVMGGKIEAWHNVMSMLRPSDFATDDIRIGFAFFHLFENCTSLTKAPILPATTFINDPYQGMFLGCTSLTKAPELPATTLSPGCYSLMFSGCRSLTEAPELPATTLADLCYRNMFEGCQSLTKAPALPATTLANSCYHYMFSGCQSLTKAPELPATTLTYGCYYYMFSGCQSLKEVRVSATTTANDALKEWLSGVSSTGDFYCDPSATIFPSDSTSGIPSGWRRLSINEEDPTVDDITKPLTFRATQDGSTVTLTKVKLNTSVSFYVSFQTSRDGGNTWTNYTLDSAIRLNTGEEVSFRTQYDRTGSDNQQNAYKYTRFTMTGKIEAWHNVMSLYSKDEFATYNPKSSHCFYQLFASCTSLTKAPALPATRLYDSCYSTMFVGCTSLKEAPELPATKLYQSCYFNMFNGCTSLTKAPALTATELAPKCYTNMFNNCSSLNEVHCNMPSTISAEDIPTYTGGGSTHADGWLYGVSSTGTFYTNADANWPSGSNGIPTGWNRVPAVDDITKPLTLKAIQDGSTVSLTMEGSPSGAFQTSRDGGNTWEDYSLGTAITLNTDDEVSFRAKTDRTSSGQDLKTYFYFVMGGKIEAWHNVMSMLRPSDFATYSTASKSAFNFMFKGCTSLTKAPALPATTLAKNCYSGIFEGCTSLTEAPALPATTLDEYCYSSMFKSCQSLTKAPELPETTLPPGCYSSMFSGCQSLTKAPELPATTLANSCYYRMFLGCQSLTKAPELPATALANSCYRNMFEGCQSLKEVRVSATTNTATDALTYWLSDVSATGDFYCNPNATIFPTGVSGIPANWVRRNIADYPTNP